MAIFNLVYVFILVAHLNCITAELPPMTNVDKFGSFNFKQKPVSSCNACNNMVKSFLKALIETTRESFEGGDADWERQKLGSYENSELRFIEIQERLCTDVESGKEQCYNLAELHEQELENWFYNKRIKNLDLFTFLCIDTLKVCCLNNTYGPNCVPCPGGVEQPCGGHGKCENGGTRQEPAYCVCDDGYKGELCDQCVQGYYKDETYVLSCKICDKACKAHCRGPGPKNCEVCADGYRFSEDKGCIFQEDWNPLQMINNMSNETENIPVGIQDQLETPSAAEPEHSEL